MLAFLCLGSCRCGFGAAVEPPRSPRWQDYTRVNAARGGHKLLTSAATYFGTTAWEEVVAGGTLPDQRILVVGNTFGPEFPDPKVMILGKGEWYDLPRYVKNPDQVDKDGNPIEPDPEWTWPNACGFIAIYSPDLTKLEQTAKFDPGVATIQTAKLFLDGDLILVGTCTEHFRESIAKSAELFRVLPIPEPTGEKPEDRAKSAAAIKADFGPIWHAGFRLPGDTYVARVASDLKTWRWVWVLEGHRTVDRRKIWTIESKDEQAVVFISGDRMLKVSKDGTTIDPVYAGGSKGHSRAWQFLGVDPKTGNYYRGGDRMTRTGREPWRKPTLKCFDGKSNEVLWSGWDWASLLVGHDRFRLVSDSAIRNACFTDDGDMFISAWSDGGNTLCCHQSHDLTQGLPRGGFGLSAWGVTGAKSFAHLIRINAATADGYCYELWCTFLPRTGWPNSAFVDFMTTLADGSLAMITSCAWTPIQTPHNYYRFPPEAWNQELIQKWVDEGNPRSRETGGSGTVVAVFDKNLSNLRFSSLMPHMDVANIGRGPRQGLLIFNRSAGIPPDELQGRGPPLVKAVQPEFGGGRMDGHIILLQDPEAR